MIEFLLNPTVIASFFSFIGGICLIVLKDYFGKHQQKVELDSKKSDINSQLIENLWKELDRLQIQITNLQKREVASEAREEKLKEIIEKLQLDNTKQTFEILQLKKEINDLRNGNKT
jgi:hypothetical protein